MELLMQWNPADQSVSLEKTTGHCDKRRYQWKGSALEDKTQDIPGIYFLLFISKHLM